MSDRMIRLAVCVATAVMVLALALVVAFTLASRAADVQGLYGIFVTAMYGGVGATLAFLRPRNAVGRLLLAVGVLVGASLAGAAYVEWSQVRDGELAGASLAAWAGSLAWLVLIAFLVPRLMLLFPDGRPPSPRWRVVSVAQYVTLAGLILTSLEPGPLSDYRRYDNPVGIQALAWLRDLPTAFDAVGIALLVTGALGGALSVVVRFRRSTGVERQQMKWVAWVVAVTAVLFVVPSLLPYGPAASALETLAVFGFGLAPAPILIAVLRYRLYDIDVVIRKTLVYGASTVFLGLAYIGFVLAGQAVFSSFTGGSNLAIAVSTLVVAALFLPVRSRVQGFVDRRFYRRRYDARRTLETFGTRLREQIDLGTLELELRGVVNETMQPSHASVWRRDGVW